jgi:YfiH family protein
MAETFQKQHHTYFGIEDLSTTKSRFIAGFSSRHGGCSKEPFQSLNLGLHVNDEAVKVLENRRTLAHSINTELNQWVFADQIHGKEIHEVSSGDQGKGSELYNTGIMGTDGFYTKEKGIILALAYADCVPIYFTSRQHSIIGIAHAGWKGTVSGIAQEMIEKWTKEECVPVTDIEVWIGPSIQQCCYEVDERVISFVDGVMQGIPIKPYIATSEKGKYMLSLQKLNERILLDAGLQEDNIRISSHCTSCQISEFFSHRKENGKTGRMLGFIMMKE